MPKLGAIGAFLGIRQGHHRRQQWHQRVNSCTDAATHRKELKLLPVLPMIEDQGLSWQTEASGYETRAILSLQGTADAGERSKSAMVMNLPSFKVYAILPRRCIR